MKLADAITQFIAERRRYGYKYKHQAEVLNAFSASVGNRELNCISVEQVKVYLNLRPNLNQTSRQKHQFLTRFFRYWQFRGEIDLLAMPMIRPFRRSTFVPHIFSEEDIRGLIAKARSIRNHPNCARDGETMSAFLLFLYSTGAHCLEVIALNECDVDLESQSVRIGIRDRKNVRTIPIGPEFASAMSAFLAHKRSRGLNGPAFFQREDGSALVYDGIREKFKQLLRECMLVRNDGRGERPRLSDLRASFAVHRVSAWVRSGDNLGRLVPALAAYMGKADISDTERMMSMVPDRFRSALEDLACQTRRGIAQ